MEGINDLKLIKKHYNEKMAHLCRELFPTILETPGLLYEILTINFDPSKFLYEDIMDNGLKNEFRDFICSQIGIKEEPLIDPNGKTPFELLDEAGYDLYECKTEEEIQSFKKYYALGEELCTFNGGRLDRCHVFFAVKKHVDKIKREDFDNPRRQDEYGTSVISIQFTKDDFVPSIKNRYNHAVENPDNTFNSHLDNIIPGLTKSFEDYYGFEIKKDYSSKFEIPGYVKVGGKFYKYNIEYDNIYYCPNNVVIEDFRVKKYDKEKYIVFDNFVLSLEKTETDNDKYHKLICDPFVLDCFEDTLGKIKKVSVEVENITRNRIITINENIVITLNSKNEMIGYSNQNITKIRDNFMYLNRALEHLDVPNVESIGIDCLVYNTALKSLDLPKTEMIGKEFLLNNTSLKHFTAPNLEIVDNQFLESNLGLEELYLPKLTKTGLYFMSDNVKLKSLVVPNLKRAERGFLPLNEVLNHLEASRLEFADVGFLRSNLALETISLPNLIDARNSFICGNEIIREVNFPKLKYIGDDFMTSNKCVKSIEFLNAIAIGHDFFRCNPVLTKALLPNVKRIGNRFMQYNIELSELDLSNVTSIGENFLYLNKMLRTLDVPKLESILPLYLMNNSELQEELYMRLEKEGKGSYKFYHD